MSRSPCTFAQLLQPIDAEAFLTQYWEQRSLLVSRDSPDYYAGLISVQNIDAILQLSKPKYPRVKLGKSQKRGYSLEVLEGMETQSIHGYGVPNLQRLYTAYAAGDTLVLDRVDRSWEPLARMCRDVAHYFSCPAGATLFLTPKNSQGFLPHFDHDDMFILQIEGAKVWKIYNSAPYSSLADEYQPLLKQPLPAPEQEIYLRAGDLLYIPKGCVHEVLTTDAPSLHVALDVHAFNWADLVTSALEAIGHRTVPVHKTLPVGFLNQPTPSLQEPLTGLLASLCQHANAEEAVARLARRFIDRMQPLPDGHFSQLEHLHQVTLDSTITKRRGMLCWVATHDDQVSIHFPGNAVEGPGWIAPALRFIAATDTFTVCSLPDVLSDNGKLVLVRRLMREGLLTVVRMNQAGVPEMQGETMSTEGSMACE